jgi:hypothetical protein
MRYDLFTFPTIEQVFAEGIQEGIAHVEKEHAKYTEIAATGGPGDRVRARLIAVSYRHVAALLTEIEETRRKLVETAQEPTVVAR